MDDNLARKIQIACAWCGPAFVIVYGLTWAVLGHNYPPPDPTFSAVDLVNNFYLKYRSQILLGQSLSAATGILYLLWACQLTVQMWQREKAPLLSLIQLTGGVLTTWVLIFCPVLWAWCAEMAVSTDPQMIQMIKNVHFLAWYTYDMTYMITTVEVIAIFLLVIADKTKPALMPRWAAGLALFSGLSFLPLSFLPYIKTGIFALNGYWSYHVAFITYGLFTGIIGYYMVKDLKRVKVAAAPGLGQSISNRHFNS